MSNNAVNGTATSVKDQRDALSKKQADHQTKAAARKAAFEAQKPAVKAALDKLTPEQKKDLKTTFTGATGKLKQDLEQLASKK